MVSHNFRWPWCICRRGPLPLAILLIVVGSFSGPSSHAQTLPGVTWTTSTHKLVTGASPQSVAVADFNGDGIADIAVGEAGSIGIFLGNGDGTFKPADSANDGVTISLPLTAPLAIASGAFQAGKPPGIVAVSASYDAVILSNGSGGEMSPAPFTGVNGATSVVAANFYGTGVADLAVAGLSPGSAVSVVAIYPNTGSGSFGTPTLFPIASNSPGFLTAGDFIGNGVLDFAVTDNTSVDVFLNEGSGNFSPGVGGTAGNGPSCIAVGDFNGDGKQDLAVLNKSDGTVSVLLSSGDSSGTFTTKSTVSVGSGPSCIVVGDFNKDGKADLAVTNQNDNTVSILLGNGDGTFAAPAIVHVGSAPTSLAVGDFSGNGNVDLAVANSGDNSVTILQSQVGTAPTPTPTPTPSGGGGGGGGGGNGSARLINISTRAMVGTGANILIPGICHQRSRHRDAPYPRRRPGPVAVRRRRRPGPADPERLQRLDRHRLKHRVGHEFESGPDHEHGRPGRSLCLHRRKRRLRGHRQSLGRQLHGADLRGQRHDRRRLAEVYEVSTTGTRLINISTRAKVGTGGNILIPGFVISGTGTEELLVRGDGPSLAQFSVSGILAQVTLGVFNGSTMIASNTGWGTSANPGQIASVAAQVGAFAFAANSADSAQIVNLTAGPYTIQISGVNGTTGVALAEVYEVPQD